MKLNKEKDKRNLKNTLKTIFSKSRYIHTDKIDYKLNYKKGIVSSPEIYLRNCTPYSEFEVKKVKVVEGVGHRTCRDFGGKNNCTLTALYNLLIYCREKRNFEKIPDDREKLYELIVKSGRRHLYTKRRGMPVYMNSFFVTDVINRMLKIKSYKGKMIFFPSKELIMEFLNKDIPFIYSLASKPYFNHSIVVYGYRVYKEKTSGKEYTFLLVYDGWAHITRFLSWDNLNRRYTACMTYIK